MTNLVANEVVTAVEVPLTEVVGAVVVELYTTPRTQVMLRLTRGLLQLEQKTNLVAIDVVTAVEVPLTEVVGAVVVELYTKPHSQR